MALGSPRDFRLRAREDDATALGLHVSVETENDLEKRLRISEWIRCQRKAAVGWNFLIIGAASRIQAG
jgi:hypothetical protein